MTNHCQDRSGSFLEFREYLILTRQSKIAWHSNDCFGELMFIPFHGSEKDTRLHGFRTIVQNDLKVSTLFFYVSHILFLQEIYDIVLSVTFCNGTSERIRGTTNVTQRFVENEINKD